MSKKPGFSVKYFFLFFTMMCFVLTIEPIHASLSDISVSAEGALLINADTGAILYEKKSKELYFPASITKIATALFVLDKMGDKLDAIVSAEPDCVVTVTSQQKARANYTLPPHWQESDGCHIGIKAGERLTLRDLLFGMLIASGNDAANVIAHYVSGSVSEFMNELNEYLKQLGCVQTHFLNPHGLHHPDHQTTAYDMALITREALKNSVFREIVSTVRYTRPKTNKQDATTLVQTNRLLRSGKFYYPKAIGVKTGSHSKAMHTFVGAAEHEGRTLITVFLHSKERNDIFQDSIALFEAAFKESKIRRILLKGGSQKYALKIAEAANSVQAYLKEDLAIEYYPAEKPDVKVLVFWDSVSLPIAKDQRIGEAKVLDSQGNVLRIAEIYSQKEIKGSLFYRLKSILNSFLEASSSQKIWGGILFFVMLISVGIVLRKRKNSVYAKGKKELNRH